MAYKKSIENLKTILTKKNLNIDDFCFIIVERFSQGQWSDQIYYLPKSYNINALYKIIVKDSKDAYFFQSVKTNKQFMPTTSFK